MLLTEAAVRQEIDSDSDSIAEELENHPNAGAKFSKLREEEREAWIAWTWLFKRLVKQGCSHHDAIEIRSGAISRQHAAGGTYAAITETLNTFTIS